MLSPSDHPFFLGVQFHPEMLSRPLRPAPTLVALILAAAGKVDQLTPKGGEDNLQNMHRWDMSGQDKSDEDIASGAIDLGVLGSKGETCGDFFIFYNIIVGFLSFDNNKNK